MKAYRAPRANCVLLLALDDVERQFSLSARSRLSRHEVGAILKALRRVDERTNKTGTVVATSSEIVRAELDREFEREWARDARSEQRSLLLLTARRAKGLEFYHVVMLNGGWARPSKGEETDATRRLFYVAMTRACRSLAIIADRRHPFLPSGPHALLTTAPSTEPKN